MTKTVALIFAVVMVLLLVQGPAMKAQNPAAAGNAANGKIAFMKAGCYACHGTLGQGGPGGRLAPNVLPKPIFMNTVRNGKIEEGQSRYWDGMPPFSTRFVSDAELTDIYAYLAGIPAPPPVKDIPLLKN